MLQFVNVPNLLSLTRILFTPLFIWLLFKGGGFLFIAVIVFTLAALTDSYDGYIARRDGLVTELGNFLDPLADKILIFGTFFALQLMKVVPGWFVCILIVRDILITTLRLVMLHRGKSLVTSKYGKVKTVVQFMTIYSAFLYLICYQNHVPAVVLRGITYGVQGALYVATGLMLFSGIDYLVKNRFQLLNSK